VAVLVHINGSVTLRVEADLDTFEKAYKTALAKNQVLRIRSGDGKIRVVNARQIAFFEDEELPEGVDPERPEVAA
jgi:hypothetical protein